MCALLDTVRFGAWIGIGGHLAVPPLPHHRAYGSRTRRFDGVKLGRRHGVEARAGLWGAGFATTGSVPLAAADRRFTLVRRFQGQ